MSRELTTEDRDALEAILDRYSVRAVLEALAGICFDKADHVRTNWQDDITARAWDRDAKAIDKLSPKTGGWRG